MTSDVLVNTYDGCSNNDQNKILEEAIFFVKEQSYYMKKSIELEDLCNALKHGSNIVSELRLSSVSPTHYYELYMKVFNELQYLSDFIGEQSKKSNIITDLYESVQQATFILPRLYLLVMVGSHYIKSKKVSPKEILDDITELCKGIQHPMRGLFLRYYLVQMCKDKLPDSDPNDKNGFIDSFNFLMNNFSQSIRLWIRLNTPSLDKGDKKRMDKERIDLGLLVGANLVRITQLEGVDLTFYSNQALPLILKEINEIADPISQEYLFDCLIQAFSDEYHLHTINEILSACVSSIQTNDGISIIITLMSRISDYILSNDLSLDEVDIFKIFNNHISSMVVEGASVESTEPIKRIKINGYLELQASFLEFTLKLYPSSIEYVQIIQNKIVSTLSEVVPEGVMIEGLAAFSIVRLLTIPLKSLSLKILELDYNQKMIKVLNSSMRKKMAYNIIDELVGNKLYMEKVSNFETFYQFISPLFTPSLDEFDEYISDKLYENIKLEQYQVCKMIHAIHTTNIYDKFEIHKCINDRIVSSGRRRMEISQPCIIFALLKLISHSIKDGEIIDYDFIIKIYKFVNDIIDNLVILIPEMAIKLLMMISISINECGVLCNNDFKLVNEMKVLCNNYLMKACNCYEDHIANGSIQLKCIKYMSSVLSSRIYILEKEEFNSLAMRIAKYGLYLTRIKHICDALTSASYMFHAPNYLNENRIIWCLEKCIEITSLSDFIKPELCVESLTIPLNAAKFFKLQNTVNNIQNKINQYKI